AAMRNSYCSPVETEGSFVGLPRGSGILLELLHVPSTTFPLDIARHRGCLGMRRIRLRRLSNCRHRLLLLVGLLPSVQRARRLLDGLRWLGRRVLALGRWRVS